MTKRIVWPLALIVSLVVAAPALAHHPVASATQTCVDEGNGQAHPPSILITASFDNPGFATAVTATDSGGAALPPGTAPYSESVTVPGPDRAAGTVTFTWQAEHDSGTITASYEAVSRCETPPPPPTTTTTTPPPPPPGHTHIGTPLTRHSPRKPSPPTAQAPTPPGVQNGQLPFSGEEEIGKGLIAVGLLLAGVALGLATRKTRSR